MISRCTQCFGTCRSIPNPPPIRTPPPRGGPRASCSSSAAPRLPAPPALLWAHRTATADTHSSEGLLLAAAWWLAAVLFAWLTATAGAATVARAVGAWRTATWLDVVTAPAVRKLLDRVLVVTIATSAIVPIAGQTAGATTPRQPGVEQVAATPQVRRHALPEVRRHAVPDVARRHVEPQVRRHTQGPELLASPPIVRGATTTTAGAAVCDRPTTSAPATTPAPAAPAPSAPSDRSGAARHRARGQRPCGGARRQPLDHRGGPAGPRPEPHPTTPRSRAYWQPGDHPQRGAPALGQPQSHLPGRGDLAPARRSRRVRPSAGLSGSALRRQTRRHAACRTAARRPVALHGRTTR